MKKLIILAAFVTTAYIVQAQTATSTASKATISAVQPSVSNTPADPNAAEITFENTTMDYGTIKQGAEGNRTFKFKNSGKEPLVITSCHGSCGCTVPKCPTEPILPGKDGVINVHYDTNRIGAFTKTVTVSSNAKNATVILKITGTVEANASSVTPAVTPSGH